MSVASRVVALFVVLFATVSAQGNDDVNDVVQRLQAGESIESLQGGNMPGGGTAPIVGKQSDLPFIQCAVCKHVVKRAIFVTQGLRKSLKHTVLSEDKIYEEIIGHPAYGKKDAPPFASGGVCNPESKQGEWLTYFDLQEDKEERKLVLKKMPVAGECGVECKTVAMACTESLAESDAPLVEALYHNTPGVGKAELEKLTCSAFCSKPPPPVPADREAGATFQPKTKPAPPPPTKKAKRKGKAEL